MCGGDRAVNVEASFRLFNIELDREVDGRWITDVPELPRVLGYGNTRELRERASQEVFARYLNVTRGIVSQWERGEKRPQGASLKLLSLVAKNGLQAVA